MPLLPAPEPEPAPPELGTAPELPMLPLLLPLGLDVLPELVPPALEPLPVVTPSSFRHFSRSEPVMPRHLLLVLPAEAPLLLGELALGELVLGELLLGELLLGELLLGELELLLPVAPVELLPDAPEAPEAPLDELSDELLPVAPALVPAPPPAAPPDEEPELCAHVALESAKSAAAVAALMSFNVISVFSFLYLLVPEAPPLLPEPMPDPLLPEPMPEPLPVPEPGVLVVLLPLPDAPPLELLLLGLLLLAPLLVPPPDAAPAPDFLKCASHSSREICPSLFLSTDEKLGVWELAPPEAPAFGALEAPPEALLSDDLPAALLSDDLPAALLSEDLPAELLPEAPPEALSEDLLSAAPALVLPDPDAPPLVLCASATPASANRAAAVAVLTTFLTNMCEIPPRGIGENCRAVNAMSVPAAALARFFALIGHVGQWRTHASRR